MLTRLKNSIPTLISPSQFTLEDLENFPYDIYQQQLSKYNESESWYSGAALDNQLQPQSGKQTDLYPMRINPIRGTVQKHAYTLFGEVENDGRPLVVTRMLPMRSSEIGDDSWKKIAQEGEDALNMVWWENNGRELMIRNAMLSQIYGGCVFKATYQPWEAVDQGGLRQIPIRIEAPNPKTFIGIPDASDYYRLAEFWIVRQIDRAEAFRWGYQSTRDDEELWYTEWWNREFYRIQINKQLVTKTIRGESYPLGGINPFGVTPAVYIPHVRDTEFLGSNSFDHLTPYVKELNLRYGDYGDATNDDAHPIVAIRDVSGSVQMRKITSWLEVVDLGQTQGITGNEKPPDMMEVRQQRASTAMKDLIDEIWQQYQRDSFVSPVAYGEDEGSQRSGMTLAMRFWPLGSHASTERYFWTAGLDIFQPILLRMMLKKKLLWITEEHLKLRMKQAWAPLLPRDREADVQEWAQRAANFIGSPEHLLDLAGDVEDVPEERVRMLKWIEDKTLAEQRALHQFAMEQQAAEAEASLEQIQVQGETQLKAAEVQAKAFAQRPAGPPVSTAEKKGGVK